MLKVWPCIPFYKTGYDRPPEITQGEYLMEIKVYGDTAKKITEGQVFTAKIGDVEGRTVVTLESED